MNAHVRLDLAQLARADEIAARLDAWGGYYLREYIGGAWVEMGHACCARDAMSLRPDVFWIEQSPTEWHSEDGRAVVRK